MTREEAIQILSTRDAHGVLCGYTSGVTEALNMAIQALQEPTREWTIQNCPKCGKFVLKDWIVCPYCGASMRPKDGEEE